MQTHTPPSLLLGLGNRMPGLKLLLHFLSHPTLHNRETFNSYLTYGYVMNWLNRQREREEESSNQYSKLDARYFSTLSHSWCLQISIIWLKWFDENSTVAHTKEKLNFLFFLKTSLTSSHSLNHGKKTSLLFFLLNFSNMFTRPSNQGTGARRHTRGVFLAVSQPKLSLALPFPMQPSLPSAPGEQLYLLSMFSLDRQNQSDKTKGVCLGKAGQKLFFWK